MKKLDLSEAAGEFEMISAETHLFYNKETGEFDRYSDFLLTFLDEDEDEENDFEKFEEACWIAAPRQWDIHQYDMMVNFAETVTDPRSRELLYIALDGKGAFRRFKDTLHHVGLAQKWYDFRWDAYIDLAREWCEENEIPYEDTTPKTEPPQTSERRRTLDFFIIPLSEKTAGEAAEILHEAFGSSPHEAEAEIRRMQKKNRITLAAVADNRVVGIIGAIPQYGVTGWELHPLAVRKEYQLGGIGGALVEALEKEVSKRGGVMIYLGSDDESGTTSLYGEDLYEDTFGKIANIQNIGDHPYSFYEKMGYQIVGVFPDANGIGKPDIWMAKRLGKYDFYS